MYEAWNTHCEACGKASTTSRDEPFFCRSCRKGRGKIGINLSTGEHFYEFPSKMQEHLALAGEV